MAGKFAINGKVVRTSKTMDYTHALVRINTNGAIDVISCHNSEALAIKAKASKVSEITTEITTLRGYLAGKYGRKSWEVENYKYWMGQGVEKINEAIERNEIIRDGRKAWAIVHLEKVA